ncbi:hypothetical protein HPB52_012682 [Rhipicephalus sanguineus]|uniref:Uncharacterized protein n=1 Tax=Rhipicephalus sanguineus TaxID=34632 RepID=A0A9D4PCQ9_RHISA|nr:hypothetical protein HPB52_012682 [Rhipicephalus sanguineus]
MMEPEEAASKLASGMIVTIVTVVVGVIVVLIICCVCCIRGCFRPERDIRAVVVQQGVHPDPYMQQLGPVTSPGPLTGRAPTYCQM